MLTRQLPTGFALALLLAGGSGAAHAEETWSAAAELERLGGVYESSGPEPWYGGYGTRRFTFENGTWTLTFTHALDPAMTIKTFQFRTGGPYAVGAPSVKVDGAFDAVFGETTKHVTLLTSDQKVVTALGFASCSLKTGVEMDISETGCGPWKPLKDCGEDHDLLAMKGESLYFGVRPPDNDMCTAAKRPTALFQPVLNR